MSLQAYQHASFIDTLPKKPFCAENYHNGTLIRSKLHAIQYAHIQLNSPFVFHHIILDVDYPVVDADTLSFIWESENLNLPEPSFAVTNPKTQTGHLIFTLDKPVYKSNERQYAFYEDVKNMLTQIFKADTNYKGTLAKNPLSDHWKTIETGQTYTLGELKLYAPKYNKSDNVIAFNKFKRHTINENNSQLGRNCQLFEDTRILAYVKVQHYSNLDSFYQAVLEIAQNNNYGELSDNEVADTARSIARWTWKNKDKVRPVTRNKVASIQELRERQRKAATTTAGTRHAKTLAAIESAIRNLVSNAVAMPSITKESIARLAGKSLSTIKRYAAEIDRFIRSVYQDISPALPLPEQSPQSLTAGVFKFVKILKARATGNTPLHSTSEPCEQQARADHDAAIVGNRGIVFHMSKEGGGRRICHEEPKVKSELLRWKVCSFQSEA